MLRKASCSGSTELGNSQAPNPGSSTTFDRHGIALVFLDLGMDTTTGRGQLLRNIMGAFAGVRVGRVQAAHASSVQTDHSSGSSAFARDPLAALESASNTSCHPDPKPPINAPVSS